MSLVNQNLGLAMTGGGARAAYQVGVLRYICKEFPEFYPPIITGVSAGAVNAAYLGAYQGTFCEGVEELSLLWRQLSMDKVFRTDSSFFVMNFLRWGLRFLLGGSKLAPRTQGLLDSSPLCRHLEKRIGDAANQPITGIQKNIERGRLKVIGITGTNYSTGIAVTWLQGKVDEHWQRPRRQSVEEKITIDHIMASAALPLVFPPIKMHDGWYGDGGISSFAPLSPAMHLGADRIIAISTRYKGSEEANLKPPMITDYAPVAQVIGIILDSIFLDLLDYDAANMKRINRLYDEASGVAKDKVKHVQVLILRPSIDLGKLSSQFERGLPRSFRYLERGFGTRETHSPDALSLLMFQPDYLNYLIDLGQKDAATHASEITNFIENRFASE